MSFEDVMAAVMRWTTATEALAALGAELSLAQTGETPPPEIAVALRAVSTAAGLPAVEDLDPQQRAIALSVIHLYVHQALDTLDAPGRAPGWTFSDVETYDCIWVPTFFLAETTIEQALPPLYRSLRPGGWLALGRFRSAPDPLVESTATLRTIRGGGTDLDSKRAVELLEQAGCHEVQVVQPSVPMPLELIIGQRPMS